MSVLFYTRGSECRGIDCNDGDSVLIMMLRMKGFLVAVRFRVGCGGDSNARQGRAGVAVSTRLQCTAGHYNAMQCKAFSL